MQEEYSSSQTDNSDEGSEQGNSGSLVLQTKQHYKADIEEGGSYRDTPEEEVDRVMHAFGQWLLVRAKEAKFVELVEIVTGIVLGVTAICIYNGQLHEMRRTNQLTKQAIVAANTANDLTKSLVKNEQQAIVELTIPSSPDSIAQIASGLSAQFINRGKVDALNFSATATLQKISLPHFKPIGQSQIVSITQPRVLPVSLGIGGLESVASATFDVSSIGGSDIAAVKSQTQTFKMTVSYSYSNGFGDTVKNDRCFLYLNIPPQPPSNQAWNSWDDCTMATNIYRRYLPH